MKVRKLEGRNVTVFYEDGQTTVSRKDGVLIGEEGTMLHLYIRGKEMMIPIARVIRIEVRD